MYSPFTFNDLYGYEGECNAVNVEPAGTEEFFSLVSHDSGARDGAIAFMYPQIGGANGVEPELEIMQFTGLLDKNGKEVYEGDILEFSDKWEWYRGDYGIKTLFADEEERKELKAKYDAEPMYRRVVEFDPFEGYQFSKSDLKNYFVVVGNIYENPELLNEKEK